MSKLRAKYEKLLQDPATSVQTRALLDTIRKAEGTFDPKDLQKGYRTMFGGGTFEDLSRHPDQVVRTPGYSSAAAGAYQFLPGTYERASKALGLQSFGPREQDLAALYLVDIRGGLDPFQRGEKFGTVINKLAPEWASLPTAQGVSAYGQPVKGLGDLYDFYEQRKQQLGAGGMQLPSSGNMQPTGSSRPVEEIIPGALRGQPLPETEKKRDRAKGILDLFKERIQKDILGKLGL